MGKLRLAMAQALVKFLDNQYLEMDGEEYRFVKGILALFDHGSVPGLEQALEQNRDEIRVCQGRNEQGMACAATGFASQSLRRQIIACTSSVGPGAANRLPLLRRQRLIAFPCACYPVIHLPLASRTPAQLSEAAAAITVVHKYGNWWNVGVAQTALSEHIHNVAEKINETRVQARDY